MITNSAPRPSLLLQGTDRDWAISLSAAIHELDSEFTLLWLAEKVLKLKLRESDPALQGEDLEERVYEELLERLDRARSLSDLEELFSVIRDVDPDFETYMFGERYDRVETFLASTCRIRKSASHALDGLTSYIHTYPERIQADPDGFLTPPASWMDDDQIQEWREEEMTALMIGRRNQMLAALIHDGIA